MNKHNKHYRQLTQEPRYQISALRKTGMKVRAIALEVGVHFSTVSRELRRNAYGDSYDAVIAHQLSEIRKITADKANKRNGRTDAIIKEYLAFRWSPETISQRLRIEAEEHEQLSHSTIFTGVLKSIGNKVACCSVCFQGLGKHAGKAENATRKQGSD